MIATTLLASALLAASCELEPAMWADVPDVAPLRVGDTYYLEYAAGGVPENWSYSTAKSVHGPWTFRGKIMENAGGTGTIHGGSVLFNGEWYMVYHDGHLPGGADCRRSACIERYVRNPDGSIPFIKPTKSGVSASQRSR